MPLEILAFVRKWNASKLAERSASQQHFRDLCEALGVPHPTEEDEIGANYAFEKRVTKAGGGEGFADVWRRGFFAWEYKSKGGDLKAAYKQINEYHEALENPPLLIVCDFVRFEVHTKFENLPSRVYAFTLDDLLVAKDTPTSALPPLDVLRHVFGDFNQLRPNVASARVTEAAARDFLHLAQRLELERSAAPERPSKEQIAHFLMRLVFCLFADSVGLLPDHAFRRLVANDRFSPRGFNRKLPVLFEAMSTEGGFFGADNIPYFNGGLFSDNTAIELDLPDLGVLHSASQHDWSHIEPAIFGTLFERSLDAAKRSMIGAHYTSTDDILLLIEPVVMDPLRRRWATVQGAVLAALAEETGPGSTEPGSPSSPTASPSVKVGSKPLKSQALRLHRPALDLLQNWAAELTAIRILDPACGSGNFLYVALKRLLDLWHEARVFAIAHGLTLSVEPIPNPGQLFGIEIDFYAHEIASIVVWIGFLQWKHDHGVKDEKQPLLQVLTNIQHADAIMRYDAEGKPYEPEWPRVEYIVGNPPFLGGKRLRTQLGDTYVGDLFTLYKGQVKAESDLVVYWFEKSRANIDSQSAKRAGLLATQAIRGGANRNVLTRIKDTGDIFWAISDRNWLLKGAVVHVSMVGFDNGEEACKKLDGFEVGEIYPNLTSGVNTTKASRLEENRNICFMGTTKDGPFDITAEIAREMLIAPQNVNGKLNADVVKPWINTRDITSQPRGMYIIDFPPDMTEEDASKYELPYEYIRKNVKSKRANNKRYSYARKWWLHAEPRPELRNATKHLTRFLGTTRVSVHRLFVWLKAGTLPDSATFAFARDDDYFFGLLHSSAHELWARAQGTQLREVESGFRYTPDSTFDTFPFPWPPGKEPTESEDPRVKAIADAARELVRLRDAWLNPPGIPEADLKDRTLTKLYNQRPEWLSNAHRALDRTVFAAYGWPEPPETLPDGEILARLLTLNHERAAAQPAQGKSKGHKTA